MCKRYWETTGFPTLIDKNMKEKLKKLMSVYREQKKNENKSSKVLIARREEWTQGLRPRFRPLIY